MNQSTLLTANISNIQRFSLHDGPGIRTTVFFKGCPLRCRWCHNPETYQTRPRPVWHAEKCIGCGDCVSVCPGGALTAENGKLHCDFGRCASCFACAEHCPSGALQRQGGVMSLQEVLAQTAEDEAVCKSSGGGVTLSGGEPTMQPEFALELLRALRERGLHTALDTCGDCEPEVFEKLLPWCDLVLFDVKCADSEHHRELTGRPNERILRNLRALDAAGAASEIRIPVIPGENDDDGNLRAVCEILAPLRHVQRVILLGYHRLGLSKLIDFDGHLPDRGYHSPSRAELETMAKKMSGLLNGFPVETR